MKNTKRIWSFAAILFLILTAASAGFFIWLNKSMDILEKEPISTGVQNRLMEYDNASDILFMGTYQNKLIAFKNEKKKWEHEARGPFCSLKIYEPEELLYAANEDNHIYVLNASESTPVRDINVGKRINDMDISPDGNMIAVSTSVGKMKNYLSIFDAQGNEVSHEKLVSKVSTLAFTQDGKHIVMGNNRGEIIQTDLKGNETSRYEGDYPAIDMTAASDGGWLALFGNTSYALLDENLKLKSEGKPSGMSSITPTCIFMDKEQGYIYEGTQERYFYIINPKNGATIYDTRLASGISDMIEVNGRIYITGLGDWVSSLKISSLDKAEAAYELLPILKIILPAAAVLLVLSLLMTFRKTHSFMVRLGKTLWRFRLAYLLLIPTFILLILFNYIPVFMAFTRAFTNWSKDNYTLSQLKFIGLDNFKLMISEGYFLIGLGNLAILLVTAIIKVLTVPVIVAYLVYTMSSGKKKYVFRFLLVLPMVVPSVVNALLWNQIYDPSIGLLNQLLGRIGLENLQHVWLGDQKTALWAIIFVGFPFVNALAFLVFYGGFLDIDSAMIEAARVDGAGRWKTFWSIQLPLIKPQIKMMLLLTFIGTVQDFTNIYLLTGGGPGKSTYVPGLELYFNAAQFGRYGYACALGLIMFLFILIPTIINMRRKKVARLNCYSLGGMERGTKKKKI